MRRVKMAFGLCLMVIMGAFSLITLQANAQVPAPAAVAEENSEQLLWMNIPTITVVSKAEQDYREVPMSVYVVTKEELDRWGVRNLDETLQRVPGFAFFNTDYYGQYGVSARGSQSVWRYGASFELMPIVDFGHMTFTPHFFKSIEVARGPSGLMWGSGAEAGLMNFNIRDDLRGLETAVEYGERDRRVMDVMYGNKLDTGHAGDSFFLGWHYEHQGYEQENGVNYMGNGALTHTWKSDGINPSQTILAKLQYKDVKFIALYDRPDLVAPELWYGNKALEAALNKAQGNVHDQLPMTAIRGEYHIPEDLLTRFNTDLYFYANYYKKQWMTEGVALDTQSETSFGFNAETEIFKDVWKLRYGGDLWGEDTTGDPSMTTEWAEANYGINWYDTVLSPSKRTYRNAYIQSEDKILPNLIFIVGTRLDWQKDAEPAQTIWSGPRAALIYSPWDFFTVKYLHNMGVRRPQANELNGDGGANPSAEKMTSDEIVLMGHVSDKLEGSLSIYYQTLQKQIIRINNGVLNDFTNAGGYVAKGLEWDFKYHPLKRLLFYYNGSYMNKCEVHVSDPNDPSLRDEQMRELFVPAFSHFVGADYDFNWVKANIDMRSITTIPYQNVNGSYSTKDTQFVDFTLRSKKLFHNKVQISLNCLNLFDKRNEVPAYGEHSGDGAGTITPEGRMTYARVVVDW